MIRSRGFIGWILLVSAFILNYAHRLSLATIGEEIMLALTIEASSLGILSSVYFYGYGGATLLAGLFVDRFGTRTVATLGLLVAAVGGLVFASAHAFGLAVLGRFLLACGLAVILPAIIKLQREWFPPKTFATMVGIVSSAANLAALVAIGTITLAATAIGWRQTIVSLSLLTMLNGIFVWWIVRDRPAGEVVPLPRADNQEEILPGYSASTRSQIWRLLRDRRVWPPLLASFGNYGGLIALVGLWGAPYLQAAYGMELP